jgi:immune inhibitor A
MANGHGQQGRPRHMSSWCKEMMGWLKPTVVDPSVPQHIILSPV